MDEILAAIAGVIGGILLGRRMGHRGDGREPAPGATAGFGHGRVVGVSRWGARRVGDSLLVTGRVVGWSANGAQWALGRTAGVVQRFAVEPGPPSSEVDSADSGDAVKTAADPSAPDGDKDAGS